MSDALVALLQRVGPMDAPAVLALFLICVASGLVPLPRPLVCLASGAAFGLWAIPVVVPGTALGAALAFLAARHVLAERFQSWIRGMPRTRAVLDAVDAESWRVVALLRIGSPVPAMLQNYTFGLTRIGLVPFAVATLIFTTPQIALYIYLGAAGRAALLSDADSPLALATLLVGAAALLAAFGLVVKRARTALKGG